MGHALYAEINPDYTQRPNPVELLPLLKRFNAARRRKTAARLKGSALLKERDSSQRGKGARHGPAALALMR